LENSIIAWTDNTFNIAWGCVKVSPGCKNCYADSLAKRYKWDVWGAGKERRTFGPDHWAKPVKWNKEAIASGRSIKVFCSSMCDVFEDHPTIAQEREKLWDLIRATPHLDWQLLTKRPQRIRECLPPDWGNGYKNVWLGTTIESAEYRGRADHLRTIPARVRFISYEPALGPLGDINLNGIHWLIYGGESGKDYRPHNVQWARDIRARCKKFGTAFFYKQSSAYRTEMGIELDGEIVREFPA
jgi:protein gp37